MARILSCDIVTPERKVASFEATFVAVPASDGEIGVLPMHVPLVSTLGAGEVRVTRADNGEVEHFAVSRGYVQVSADDKVIVLASHAASVADIDLEVAKGDMGETAFKLDRLGPDDPSAPFLRDENEWAKTQVRFASRS